MSEPPEAPERAWFELILEDVTEAGEAWTVYEVGLEEGDVDGPPYVRADIADHHKRERDAAYTALVDIRDAGRTATGQSAASRRAQEALDVISEMKHPSPPARAQGSSAAACEEKETAE